MKKLGQDFLKLFNPIQNSLPKTQRPTIGNSVVQFPHAHTNWKEIHWVLVGVPDDRGVTHNYGRAGAALGPKAFRELFYQHSLASLHPGKKSLLDLGDFILLDDLEQSLNLLKESLQKLLSENPELKLLIVGGGHDIAYSEIMGSILAHPQGSHHVINLDAHSDLRPLESGNIISSGTPFYRLIEAKHSAFLASFYHPFGLQKTSNTQELVQYMQENQVPVSWLEDMPTESEQLKKFLDLVQKVSSQGQHWHLNIDLDGFPLNFAPGVSAPGVFGLSPQIFLPLIKTPQVLSNLRTLGIYELAPNLDEQNKTARLAAKLAYFLLSLDATRRSSCP